jgi:hypothetical protein
MVMTLRRLILGVSFFPMLGACSLPFRGGGDDKKAECDQMAAEAIQTKDLTKARELSAGASACYARLAQ